MITRAPATGRPGGTVFRLFYLLSYGAFRLCEGVVRLLPLSVAFAAGRAGGTVAYYLFGRRRRVAMNNLRLAFGGEKAATELRQINREHFQLLGANLLAGFKASRMPDEKIWARVTDNVPADRLPPGWIALISHIGNWELLSHLGARFPGYRFGAIYQTLANPYIDRYLRESRTRSGNILFDRRTELLKCFHFLRGGGVVGLLIDQGAGYAGLWTPLFNRLTSSTTFAATLAIRTGSPVVPIAINTTGHARWTLNISDPVFPPEEDVELFTAQINRLLENQIRHAPADWLWSHNRWKPLRPHILFARDQRRVYFPPEFDRATLKPFRILIVSPEAAAAATDTFPAVHAIWEGRPDNSLGVLAPSSLRKLWEENPDIGDVIPASANSSAFSLAAALRAAGPFDAAIFFSASWRTALAVRFAGIPLRIGRRRGPISRLFNQHPAEPPVALDPVQDSLQIAHSIGANIPPRP
ncbi:MAG: hypothetical protein ACR2F0_08580 [Chthoniobacterales bacterium]